MPPTAAVPVSSADSPVTVSPTDGSESRLPDAARMLQAWLPAHCKLAPGLVVGLIALQGSQVQRLAAAYPSASGSAPWMLELASMAHATRTRAATRRKHARLGELQAVAHPLVLQGRAVGAAVVVFAGQEPASKAVLAALDASVAALAAHGAGAAHRDDNDALALLALQEACARRDARSAADALCLRAGAWLGCDRVSVALLDGRAVRIAGSSDDWETESPQLLPEVHAAASEALDDGTTVIFPVPEGVRAGLVAAHRQLQLRRGAATALCTVPWFHAGKPVGALLAERAGERPFTGDDLRLLEGISRAVAPWFALARRLDRPWYRQALDRLSLPSRGHAAAVLDAAVVLVALLAWPIEREISAPVRLEGAIQRVLTAPGDGVLRSVLVRPGEVVKAGQALVEFDSEDLRVERTRVQAEVQALETAAGDAMARDDLAALALERAKAQERRTQLALLDRRIERTRIEAPFNGVVIQGDLTQMIGASIKRGDTLLVVAPSGDFRAIVEIGEKDIASLRMGHAGTMVLTAMPTRTLPVEVRRITPLATAGQGRSYFEAEVAVKLPPQADLRNSLRPGMEGIAHFAGQRGARLQVWVDAAWSWLRMAWWRWGA